MRRKAQRRPRPRHDLGIDVAGRNVVADEQAGSEPAAPLVILRVNDVRRRLARVNSDWQSTFQGGLHVSVVGDLVALREAAQVDAESDQAFKCGAAAEIFPLYAVDVGEV